MKNIFFIINFLCCFFLLSACNIFDGSFLLVSSRPVTIETLDLYDQQNNELRGNWIFRRERLLLVDQELSSTQPDMVLLQNIINRRGSFADSDKNILKSGALQEYSFDTYQVNHFTASDEVESQGVAVSFPLTLANNSKLLDDRSRKLSQDGFITFTKVEYESLPIGVFNIKMPSGYNQDNAIWDRVLREISSFINLNIKDAMLCKNRLVVGGYFGEVVYTKEYENFLDRFQLKDTAPKLCLSDHRSCITAQATNPLYSIATQSNVEGRFDRILTHRKASVNSSVRVFDKQKENSLIKRDVKMSSIYPSVRAGWFAALLLPSCSSKDFGKI